MSSNDLNKTEPEAGALAPGQAPYSMPPQIVLKAEREVAADSPDSLVMVGTWNDSSINRRFNDKLYAMYRWAEELKNSSGGASRLVPQYYGGISRTAEPLKVLDLGCAGGGFVRTCLDDGCLAVGLEGSDCSKRYRRAEWRFIPEHLFTCDITERFEIFVRNGAELKPLRFDVVTCWEVIEHITEQGLNEVAANVRRHLAQDGIWIMSVSRHEEVKRGARLHQTVKRRAWWIRKFAELGFYHSEPHVRYFHGHFVRGPRFGAPGSFHLVLAQDKSCLPPIPPESVLRRIFDIWLGSPPQKLLHRILRRDY